MFAEERKSIILDMLKDKGSVALPDLMERFDVSEATVRRDLTELDKAGMLYRTHGGAVSVGLSVFEEGYAEKEFEYLEEKLSIAKICADMINDGDTVLLDSGTTTFEIFKAIRNKKITLITNSATIISAFQEINDTTMNLVCTGGTYRSNFRSFIGYDAEMFIRSIIPDKVFLAANGFSAQNGATTPSMTESSIKKAMVDAGKKVYLVADSSKDKKNYFSVIARPEIFDGIITDIGISSETIADFSRIGVPIITEGNVNTVIETEGVTNMEIAGLMKEEDMTMALNAATRPDAIGELADMLLKSGAISDRDEIVNAAMLREEEFSTGIGFQVAIPHAKSKFANRSAIAFGMSAQGVEWPTEDGKKPKMIFLIVVPLAAKNDHLKLLAQISRKLIHDDVREKILFANEKKDVINALI